MIGKVDVKLRALVTLPVRPDAASPAMDVVCWIDTAFNGVLTLPSAVVEQLGLRQEATSEAILADGSRVELEAYVCQIEWFGKRYETQVVASESEMALLGTGLLHQRRLTIDYASGTVELV